MYCSINEAWSNNNSMEILNKKYKDNMDMLSQKQFKIDQSVNNIQINDKSSKPTTTYNENIFNGAETEINTEDIMLSTEEPYTQYNVNRPILKQNCEELVNKVLSCPICKRLMIEKLNLNNNNIFNNILKNNDVKELTILILIGLIVIILLDLFIKIVK